MARTGLKIRDMQDRAQETIDLHKRRNNMFDWVTKAWQNDWDFPMTNIPDWMHTVSSSDLHDALRSGSQILSTTAPKVRYYPLSDTEPNKEKASRIERSLAWQYAQASRRSQSGNLTQGITFNALAYANTAAQVVYLPYQQEAIARWKGSKNQRTAAERHGKFAVLLRNPRNVYPTYSDYMLEEVLYNRLYDITSFKGVFGNEWLTKLQTKWKQDKKRGAFTYVHVYDFMDHENRYIWAKPVGKEKNINHEYAKNTVIMVNEKHGLPFLPWVVRSKGMDWFDEPEDRLNPLLYPLYKSGHWDTQNVILTLLVSKVISYAFAPVIATETHSGEGVDIDYTEPATSADLRTGERLQQLAPPQLDRGQTEILDRITGMIGKESVAQILQNPEIKADVPFSAMNLIYQLGANTLHPYKKLSEDSIAEIMTQMLYWLDFRDDKVISFGTERGLEGEQIMMGKGDFDVDNIYIDVNLEAKIPAEEVAKANAAALKVDRLKYPLTRALEDMGVTDPDVAIKEWEAEQRRMTELQIELQMRQQQAQMMMQQAVQQVQMQQQQQQQAQMGQTKQQTFNPNMQGTPPAQAAPEMTRERVTGEVRGGGGIA
jgi:hypothetical protein